MFLNGYRALTDNEVVQRMEKHEKEADDLGLTGASREAHLSKVKANLQAEQVHVVPIENKVKKI